jgi:hypothetical protein
MAGDNDEVPRRPSRSLSRSPGLDGAQKPRCIVDFDPDEDGWEDEDAQLEGLGTSTHRSRHRAWSVIPVRKHRRVARTKAQSSTKKPLGSRDFAADLAAWEVQREEHAQELATKHSVS